MKKILSIIFCGIVVLSTSMSCTDLTENVYSDILTTNYFTSKEDVVSVLLRAFSDEAFNWQCRFERQELTGDQLVCVYRDNGWADLQWMQLHKHTYLNNITTAYIHRAWLQQYRALGYANWAIQEIENLDIDKIKVTKEEQSEFIAQLRTLRAYAYYVLLDEIRNVPLITSADPDIVNNKETMTQVPPQTLFNFIEKELNECIELLPVMESPEKQVGTFCKASAAGILVRLYLNSEVYTGVPKWDECIAECDKIINGEYGRYVIEEDWRKPFDWDNNTSREVMFSFEGSLGFGSPHMASGRAYYSALPYNSQIYFHTESVNKTNTKYCLSPSYDNTQPPQEPQLFNYKLGMVTQKFRKYPGDLRFRQYVNTSDNTHDGMFLLEGYLINDKGQYCQSDKYKIYLRDQVGRFYADAPDGVILDEKYRESKIENGDYNSGLYCIKYPYYPYSGGYCLEPDEVDMRFAEILYSKAECLLRKGDADGAGKLLNSVRKRNYENFSADIAYAPEGNVTLDMEEMLDEWGREFIMEARRRTDLIRFGRFQEEWWDKPAEDTKYAEIFPISQDALQQNGTLVQNPGYIDIAR